MKLKVSRRKEIIKLRAETNEIETRKIITRSMKLKLILMKRYIKLINV